MQEIALVHLVAKDLQRARAMLNQNKFHLVDRANGFFIAPDTRDGFAFLVTEMDPAKWMKTRSSYRKVVFE